MRTMDFAPGARDKQQGREQAIRRRSGAPPLEDQNMAGLLLHLQRTIGNQAVGQLLQPYTIQRNPPDPPPLPNFKHTTPYQPLADSKAPTTPFQLILTRAQGSHSGLLRPLTQVANGVNYKDIEANPHRFGLPQKPQNMDEYKDYLTDYLLRAMFTATDVTTGGVASGGILLNLSGYSAKSLAVIKHKYDEMLAEKRKTQKDARHLTHREFMGANYTTEELAKLNGMPGYTGPGFTDWEIATVLAIPELHAGTAFYNIGSIHESGYSGDPQDYLDMGLDPEEMGLQKPLFTNLLTPTGVEKQYGIDRPQRGQ